MTTSKEKWSYICKIQKELMIKSEQEVQLKWENIFSELFGYSRLLNEIDTHRQVQLGSTERLIPDIIIKNGTKDLFVVELKRPVIQKSVQIEMQLVSYLKQLRNNLGILICDRITLIDYDYSKSDNEQVDFDIPFEENNSDGISFVELFSKSGFSKEKIKSFISVKTSFSKNVASIKANLTSDFLKFLTKSYFRVNYTQEEIDYALNDFEFLVQQKKSQEISDKRTSYNFSTKPKVSENTEQKTTGTSISENEGIRLCISAGLPVGNNCTWASENAATHNFWANPNVDFLNNDWWLILNDKSSRKLYVFFIVRNTLSVKQLKLRSDKPDKIDLQIQYGDKTFTDTRSKIQFCRWFKKEIQY